jgi:hypothetical protein
MLQDCNQSLEELDSQSERRSEVRGVTQVDNKILIIYEETNTIDVFTNRHPFTRLKPIKVSDLKQPVGIVSCDETIQLFVCDRYDIWRVDMKSDDIGRFIKHEDSVQSVSLTARRLLLASSWPNNSLCVYDAGNGEKLQRILVPSTTLDYIHTMHAVESKHNTFFVLYYSEQFHCYLMGELNAAGQFICSSDDEQLNTAMILELDSVGRVLVADYWHGRILLFNERLKIERILLKFNKPDAARERFALNHSKKTNELIIGFAAGQVEVYSWEN